jgi:epoxide hydrolase-like predicted phosphatase
VTIRAVYIDLGGVIVRTEFQAPRLHLAERLGMEYEDVVRIVFDSETSLQASIGEITEEEHWEAVMNRLHLPHSDADTVRDEFFAGDVIDRELLDHLRSLRDRYKIGLISNAWTGLRPWIVRQRFDDVFDVMIISAEVRVIKPGPSIYKAALEQLDVAPAEAVFIDDVIENVDGARRVGMNGILFAGPDQAVDELEKMLAAVI